MCFNFIFSFIVVPTIDSVIFLLINGYVNVQWIEHTGGFENISTFIVCSRSISNVTTVTLLTYNSSSIITNSTSNVTLGPVLAGTRIRCVLSIQNDIGKAVDEFFFFSPEGYIQTI